MVVFLGFTALHSQLHRDFVRDFRPLDILSNVRSSHWNWGLSDRSTLSTWTWCWHWRSDHLRSEASHPTPVLARHLVTPLHWPCVSRTAAAACWRSVQYVVPLPVPNKWSASERSWWWDLQVLGSLRHVGFDLAIHLQWLTMQRVNTFECHDENSRVVDFYCPWRGTVGDCWPFLWFQWFFWDKSYKFVQFCGSYWPSICISMYWIWLDPHWNINKVTSYL